MERRGAAQSSGVSYFMKWTIYNESGSEVRIEARRSYPNGINARVITLVATRKAIESAERKIGQVTRVRRGNGYPAYTEPVELQEGS
jgi:hypothetical protein